MKRTPIIIVLPDIRSAMNIGAIFRTADAIAAEKIVLCGYSATPEHPKVTKTAIGAENTVPWEYAPNAKDVLNSLKSAGYQIVSLEITGSSKPISGLKPSFPVALIVGNEISGIPEDILTLSDQTVHLPMLGTKESLNVGTATGIAAYYLLEKYLASQN